jgi:hypothetical protein
MGMTMLQMAYTELTEDADPGIVQLADYVRNIYIQRPPGDTTAPGLLASFDPVSQIDDPVKKAQMQHFVDLVSFVLERPQP